ncbi:MAG: type II secretion system GspH family protein [Deltaproteobacteria bacterium]|nr:type II secretion system GspH family protein [Deltaproteobacteria bacterium]
MRFHRKGHSKKSGFSLIEVMVALAIVVILSVVAVPQYMTYRRQAYNASAESMARSFQTTQAAYKAANGAYATEIEPLAALDKNLLTTPGLSYNWIEASDSDYLFNVRHVRGNRWFTAQP